MIPGITARTMATTMIDMIAGASGSAGRSTSAESMNGKIDGGKERSVREIGIGRLLRRHPRLRPVRSFAVRRGRTKAHIVAPPRKGSAAARTTAGRMEEAVLISRAVCNS